MPSTDSLKKLCDEDWMSGYIVVEQSLNEVVLRKRHYPLIGLIFSYGFLGAFVALGACLAPADTWRNIIPFSFIVIGIFIVKTFRLAAVFRHENKPSMLVFDRAARTLSVPRLGIAVNLSNGLRLSLREVEFVSEGDLTVGCALYVADRDEAEGSPVVVEHTHRYFSKQVKRFASLANIPLLELPRITVE